MKIVDYAIIDAQSPHLLRAKVLDCIDRGYEPLGGMIIDIVTSGIEPYRQTMIKRQSALVIDGPGYPRSP